MSLDALGPSGVAVLVLLAAWFLITVPHQLTNEYGKRVKRINMFALIPGWTFFAPTPGMTDYRILFRDRIGEEYTEWREIEWCRPRRLRDAIWHPARHRTKLIVDCVNAFSTTLQEMQKLGLDVEREPQSWMISVPYLALLNIAVSMPKLAPAATARQFAVIEQKPNAPTERPRLIVCSSAHDL